MTEPDPTVVLAAIKAIKAKSVEDGVEFYTVPPPRADEYLNRHPELLAQAELLGRGWLGWWQSSIADEPGSWWW